MYRNFEIEVPKASIVGYEWEQLNSDYVVCLIHGIGEHAGRYDRIGEIFKTAGIAMVSMDLSGHGFSSGKRGHTAPRTDILTDIDKLIEYANDKYEGVPVIIYGQSMGGNIALDYRKRGKLKNEPAGYIVTSPWITLERKIPCYLHAFVKVMAKIKPDFLMNSKIDPKILGNVEIISKQKNQHLKHGKISVETAIDGFEIGEALMKGTLEQLGDEPLKPLLLMHGEADKICSPEGSRKIAQFEDGLCEYIEWEGLYHEIHNGNSTNDGGKVIETMVNWIRKLEVQ